MHKAFPLIVRLSPGRKGQCACVGVNPLLPNAGMFMFSLGTRPVWLSSVSRAELHFGGLQRVHFVLIAGRQIGQEICPCVMGIGTVTFSRIRNLVQFSTTLKVRC